MVVRYDVDELRPVMMAAVREMVATRQTERELEWDDPPVTALLQVEGKVMRMTGRRLPPVLIAAFLNAMAQSFDYTNFHVEPGHVSVIFSGPRFQMRLL